MEDLVSAAELAFFRGRRVFVTGDTGFKGAWLCLWLKELGAEVTGYALPPEDEQRLFPQARLDRLIRHVDGDVRDLDALSKAMAESRPEFVFHLAAQALVRRSYADPPTTFATNVMGTVNVLEAVRQTPTVRSVVCITSDKCYYNKEWIWGYRETDELGGADPYSASKAGAEIVFRAYWESFLRQRSDLGAATTRAGNVIGGGDRSPDRIVPDCIAALEADQPIVLRNPRATRPWQHVLDPLHGYLRLALALHRDPTRFSTAWNFGPREDAIRTVEDVAQGITTGWGGGRVVHEPQANAPHEASLLHLSSDKANRVLGWHPVLHFEEAVAETAGWYRVVRDGGSPLEVTRDQIARFHARVGP